MSFGRGIDMTIGRRDWLLLFIGLPEGNFRTDQVRTTKGMFLFTKQCSGPSMQLYTFEPYDYGPFSRELYRDLDALDAEGFIRRIALSGSNRQVFELTSKGLGSMAELSAIAPTTEKDNLAQIKKRVTSLSFTDLLTSVYGEYPEYAARSKARI